MESDDVLEYVSGLNSLVFVRGRDVFLYNLRPHSFLDERLVGQKFVRGRANSGFLHYALLDCVVDKEVREFLREQWEEDYNGH